MYRIGFSTDALNHNQKHLLGCFGPCYMRYPRLLLSRALHHSPVLCHLHQSLLFAGPFIMGMLQDLLYPYPVGPHCRQCAAGGTLRPEYFESFFQHDARAPLAAITQVLLSEGFGWGRQRCSYTWQNKN